ncbi:metal-dependent hydrolase [Paenibacillus sp. An7]|uniref:metal-dependent hydrolase n=1 Tax=Paenibacillus sp. An7 TaxID=2689577 RepID=UPI001358A471|nr:metal-dependent hydrolase [Paenibacillus sp. An7]
MDAHLYLFFHILSHALLGAAIFYILLPEGTWVQRIASVFIGGLSGIAPDLLGGRDSQPWTHSLLFAPLVVLWIALIAKLLLRKVSFWRWWGASTASAIGGHLFLDYMGHDIPLLYPFSDKLLIMEALTLGDPWVWFPLAAGLLLAICLKRKTKFPVLLAVIFVLLYCVYKIIVKSIIYQEVEARYPVGEISYITVTPNTYYEFPIDPRTWLKFKYRTISSHHSQMGEAGYWGEKLGSSDWHHFYPEKQEVIFLRGEYTLKLRNNDEDPFLIVVSKEWVEDGYHYIEGTFDDKTYLYKEITPGKWDEVEQN